MPRKRGKLPKGQTYVQTMAGTTVTDGTDQDGVTSVTVHHDAFLVGFTFNMAYVAAVDNEKAKAELSQSANYQADSNDNADTLAILMVQYSLLTTGAINSIDRVTKENIRIPFFAGDRVHINQNGSTGLDLYAACTLHWEAM